MIKKIIFLIPFEAYESSFFNMINSIKKANLLYEIWTIAPMVFPKNQMEYFKNRINDFKDENYKVIKTFFELSSLLKKLDNSDFIFHWFEYSYENYYLFKAISKSKARSGQDQTLVDVTYNVKNIFKDNVTQAFIKKVSLISLSKILNVLKRKISFIYSLNKQIFIYLMNKYYFLLGIKNLDVIIIGGKHSLTNRNITYLINEKTIKIFAHSVDYDNFLLSQNSSKLEYKYAVFLDEDVCFHPNYVRINVKPLSKQEEYFPELNSFFSKIEMKYKIKIIIAEHPRSSGSYSLKDYFNGRQVLKGNTADLVAHAEFVILHGSLSLNLAVLNKKPLIFITLNSIKESWYQNIIESRALYFEKKIINIDEVETLDDNIKNYSLAVDEERYDEYIRDFIKLDGPDKISWEIIVEALKTRL